MSTPGTVAPGGRLAVMTSAAHDDAPAPPRIELVEPEDLIGGDVDQLARLGQAEGMRFAGATLADVDLAGGSIVGCRLDGVTLDGVDLTGATVAESMITGLGAAYLDARRTTWRDVEIADSRIGAAELYDAGLDGVRISTSKLDLVNLRGARIADVDLVDTHLVELDLGGAEATRLRLRGCRVDTLDLTDAWLADVDLRGAQLSRIVGLDRIGGAVISPEQLVELAGAFAAQLGVRVVE
ncbi:pentapeptide repeat-containing protein [Nesterenkonia halophila]